MRFIAFSILFFIAVNCYANDSAGTVSSGGITFSKTPEITMLQEILTVSPNTIKIIYRFKNNSDKNITKKILFPIPPYTGMSPVTPWDTELGAPLPRAPFLNFSVIVQGKPVQFKTDTRAIMDGKDISQQLRAAHLPFNPGIIYGFLQATKENKAKLKEWREKVKKMGLLGTDNKPKWQKKVTFYWTQTFPAHKTLIMQQQYRPSLGRFLAPYIPQQQNDLLKQNLDNIKLTLGADLQSLQNGDVLKQWLEHQIKHYQPTPSNMYAYFYGLDYILTTGANWGGPIKDFTLNIDKPTQGVVAYNRFYAEQPVKKVVTKKQVQIHIHNFIPTKDLKVIFVSKMPL